MAKISPYLNFPGTTEEAFNLYRSVFGGEFAMIQRYKDTPEADKVAPEHADKIMHIAYPITNGVMLMATDDIGMMGRPFVAGNNFSMSVSADSEAEANRIFHGLSVGGKISMPLQKTFWGAYFGMLVDQFGVQWMVNHDYNEQ